MALRTLSFCGLKTSKVTSVISATTATTQISNKTAFSSPRHFSLVIFSKSQKILERPLDKNAGSLFHHLAPFRCRIFALRAPIGRISDVFPSPVGGSGQNLNWMKGMEIHLTNTQPTFFEKNWKMVSPSESACFWHFMLKILARRHLSQPQGESGWTLIRKGFVLQTYPNCWEGLGSKNSFDIQMTSWVQKSHKFEKL